MCTSVKINADTEYEYNLREVGYISLVEIQNLVFSKQKKGRHGTDA